MNDCLKKLEIFLSYDLSVDEIRCGFLKDELFPMMMHFRAKSLNRSDSNGSSYGIVKKAPPQYIAPYLAKSFDKLTELIVSGASMNRLKEEFHKEELILMLMYFREKSLFQDVETVFETFKEIEYENY